MSMVIHTFTTTELQHYVRSNSTWYSYYFTPAGLLKVYNTHQGIYRTVFDTPQPDDSAYSYTEQVIQLPADYINKTSLLLAGTPFQLQVWHAALNVPTGTTATYQQLAHAIGQPTAYRAVANALAANNIAYFIPCHRIIRTSGTLGGYRWGIEKKETLLQYEQAHSNNLSTF